LIPFSYLLDLNQKNVLPYFRLSPVIVFPFYS
jgi:hypothetical protein